MTPDCPWQSSERVAAGFLAGHRGATRASYRSDVRDLTGFAAARGRPLLLLTRTDLDDYVAHLLDERRLAVSTVRRRLAVINQVFAWAVEEDVLPRSPARRMRRPRPQAPPPRVRLTTVEMAALLTAAEHDGPRSAVLVHLLMLYGCRIGEVLGADVGDVRGPAAARRLRLLAKGGVPRELPLTAATTALVEQLAGDLDGGPLLRSATGARWHRTNAARHLRRLAAGVLDPVIVGQVHPHALRRSFVDAGLAAGATLAELQFALGHRSSAMVLVYAAQLVHGNDPVAWRVAAAITSGQGPAPGRATAALPVRSAPAIMQEGLQRGGEGFFERHAAVELALEHL